MDLIEYSTDNQQEDNAYVKAVVAYANTAATTISGETLPEESSHWSKRVTLQTVTIVPDLAALSGIKRVRFERQARETIHLGEADSRFIADILKNPPDPAPRLIAALRKYRPERE